MKFLLIFLFSFSTARAGCVSSSDFGLRNCIKETFNVLKKAGAPPMNCSGDPYNDPVCPPLAEEFTEKSAECDKFISSNKNGGYGVWGQEIVQYLNEKGEKSAFYSNDLSGMSDGIKACPNWSKMSKEEKEHFWVWVIAAIAHTESTCNPRARNGNASNGVAVGLLQLDERVSARKWRGPSCAVKSVANPRENLRCGMDIMEELIKGREGDYRGDGQIWGRRSNSYWQHLKKKEGGDISDLILLNPFCKR